jgi:predicted alpha/beta-hydrolase family hydrolase
MAHPFMAAVAAELGERGIATLRYQFPYMERRSRRPDPPKLAHATVRAAVAEALLRLPKLPLVAGGRSFGGRMTSQAQALSPLAGVRGLAFLGFPLHPAGRPSQERGQHLSAVQIPMLFLQGTRDALAELPQLKPYARARPATLAFATPIISLRAGRAGATRKWEEMLDARRLDRCGGGAGAGILPP